MSCTTFKSISISFTEPDIKPANGYTVKYRVVGAASYSTLSPNPTSSPAVIPNVEACANVEGTINTNCDGGTGPLVYFVVAPPAETTTV